MQTGNADRRMLVGIPPTSARNSPPWRVAVAYGLTLTVAFQKKGFNYQLLLVLKLMNTYTGWALDRVHNSRRPLDRHNPNHLPFWPNINWWARTREWTIFTCTKCAKFGDCIVSAVFADKQTHTETDRSTRRSHTDVTDPRKAQKQIILTQ